MTDIIQYNADDIFKDIEGDEENILMNIPPEISDRMGWKPGDVLKITVEDGIMSIVKKDDNV